MASPHSVVALAAFAALAAPAALPCQVVFTDVTTAAGVTFAHDDTVSAMAGGVCAFDHDNDGFPDLYLTNGNRGFNKLYRNNRNGTFTDVGQAAGVEIRVNSTGAYAADLDDDGDQDLLVLASGRVVTFRNEGNGKFTDVSATCGIRVPYWSMSATFGDYDRDGDLDVYFGNYVYDGFFPHFDGAPNLLFRNDGKLQFTDVTTAAGVSGQERFWDPRKFWRTTYSTTLSTLFFDYDRDGWPDLFIGNDFGPYIIPDQLFRNNGDGTFTEVGQQVGFRIAEFNMGLATADVNGDLVPDLYTTNMGANHLLLNDGRGRLFDLAPQWNALEDRNNNAPLTSWACFFMDCDLDCWPDLYVANGWIDSQMSNDKLAPSRLLHHRGKAYAHVPSAQFAWDTGHGRGAARADLDGDGDEDIVLLNNRQTVKLFRNDTKQTNAFAILDLEGSLGNRDGIGAHVVIRTRQTTQALDYTRGGSYISCNAAPIIAGLGSDDRIEELTVRWPSDVESRVFDLPANRRHAIVEPTVTQDRIGAFRDVAATYLEIPVTVHNHAPVPEQASFRVELSLGQQTAAIPTYHFPVTLNPNETRTVPVYVPIRHRDLPIAAALGIWMKVTTTSRARARDEHVMPLR